MFLTSSLLYSITDLMDSCETDAPLYQIPLLPEDVPESASLHLLWTPPVEIVPGDAVEDLQVLGAQARLVMFPRV